MLVSSPATSEEVCVNCGSSESLCRTKRRISYVSPLIFLWIVMSPLALLIAWWVTAKRLKLTYSRCEDCNSKYRRYRAIALFALGILVISLSSADYFGNMNSLYGDILLLLALIALLLCIFFWYLVSNEVKIINPVGLGFDIDVKPDIEQKMLNLKLQGKP